MEEKKIYDFLFEKFQENEKSQINLTNFVFELQSTKTKIEEILKPILIDKSVGGKKFNNIIKMNTEEKKFINLTYYLMMVWNFYTEIKEEDKEIIEEFLK